MKIIRNVIAAVAIGAACVYGGIKYQQFKDSTKSYRIELRHGAYVLVDKNAQKEYMVADMSETYAKLEQTTDQLNKIKELIAGPKNPLEKILDEGVKDGKHE